MTTVDLPGELSIAVDERGSGAPVLVLHGGGGPATVAGLAGSLSEHAHVLTPTHPGFGGRPRPEWFDSIADLASSYVDLLDARDLSRVLVVGSSIGGWIAAEMALRDNHGRIAGLVLLNAVGVAPAEPGQLADAAVVGPAEFLRLAWHNPALRPDPAAMSAEQQAAMAANQRTLAVYAGEPYMHDPKLARRLHRVTVPVLLAWGEQDGVAPVDYGRAYAELFPNGRFHPIPAAGHLPHIEQADLTLEAINKFAAHELQR
ncbi:alpha/beta fold hydrolase [Actinophytocola sp.]|uniref:alpha/beta fold hydrolase n=1 Tax=Actinophytocola sp. TaxID=1872138 RepID=UPI00389ADBB4